MQSTKITDINEPHKSGVLPFMVKQGYARSQFFSCRFG